MGLGPRAATGHDGQPLAGGDGLAVHRPRAHVLRRRAARRDKAVLRVATGHQRRREPQRDVLQTGSVEARTVPRHGATERSKSCDGAGRSAVMRQGC